MKKFIPVRRRKEQSEKQITFVLHFLSFLLLSFVKPVQAIECDRFSSPTDKPVSINIAFHYRNSLALRALNGTDQDLLIYKDMAKGFTKEIYEIRDDNVAINTKPQFLSYIKNIVRDKKTINLNFAGHGVPLGGGKSGFVLPSAPFDCVQNAEDLYRGVRFRGDLHGDSKNCMNYIVTSEELGEIFKGKKVFGIFDTCYAGGIHPGNQSSILYSAQAFQKAVEITGGKKSMGLISNLIKSTLSKQKSICMLDRDGSKTITFHEMSQNLPRLYLPFMEDSESIPASNSKVNQHKPRGGEKVRSRGGRWQVDLSNIGDPVTVDSKSSNQKVHGIPIDDYHLHRYRQAQYLGSVLPFTRCMVLDINVPTKCESFCRKVARVGPGGATLRSASSGRRYLCALSASDKVCLLSSTASEAQFVPVSGKEIQFIDNLDLDPTRFYQIQTLPGSDCRFDRGWVSGRQLLPAPSPEPYKDHPVKSSK